MKKKVFGRQLSRDINERKALFKGLLESLVMLESIQTTEAKARAIRSQAEKLVTKAKVRKNQAKQFLQPYLSPKAIEKVITDLAVRFEKRPGGYTRMIKLGKRFADNAEMAIIEWIEKKEVVKETAKKEVKKANEKVAEVVKVVKAEKKLGKVKSSIVEKKPKKKESK